MTIAQAAHVAQILNSTEYKSSLTQVIAEEIEELKQKMRDQIKTANYEEASKVEAQITALEEFFPMLERRVQYQRPAQM